ncbi:MAG: META domain-containing protein [Candidatus Hydrogenedentes bacterium]|nr:META domain-containing protein [Candidatus Hydrogenedentota bacterium]
MKCYPIAHVFLAAGLAPLLMALAGCHSANTPSPEFAQFHKLLPATYDGAVPAGDNPDRQVSLFLAPDQETKQITKFQSGGKPRVETGSWSFVDPDQVEVSLNKVKGAGKIAPNTVLYQIGGNTLAAQQFDPEIWGAESFTLFRRLNKAQIAGNPVEALVSRTWYWTGTDSAAHRIAVQPGNGYSMELLPDGKLRARADCNSAFGEWKLAKGNLSIVISGTTKAMCPPESLSLTFLNQLQSEARFTLDETGLHLDLHADSGVMHFEQRR